MMLEKACSFGAWPVARKINDIMKIIKVSASGGKEFAKLLLRQTPGGLGVWGDCKFVVNEPVEYCDWWVVCHGPGLREVAEG